MSHDVTKTRLDRRRLLVLAAGGFTTLGATRVGSIRWSGSARAAAAATAAPPAPLKLNLVATDGFVRLPGRSDPLYVFGFRQAPAGLTIGQQTNLFKGKVTLPSPIIAAEENGDVFITMANIGFHKRPDLADAHTVHWHGFRNQLAIFDGVPEASVSVPPQRSFPYFFRPRDPGTYMYHCHFEDTEHVQLGMDGIVFVKPAQNAGTGAVPPGKYVYNDGDGSTAYDREFTLLLNEIDVRPHDLLLAVQEFVWSDYKPRYWMINGRCWPDTVKPHTDPSLAVVDPSTGWTYQSQVISSLMQAGPGERVLLRIANLGYEQHSMQLDGLPMNVVGEDATLLRGPAGADLRYTATTIAIGPGESRDVIVVAPPYSASRPGSSDARGRYNRYLFRNRNLRKLTNDGWRDPATGLGGMATELRVYADGLPPQATPNQLF